MLVVQGEKAGDISYEMVLIRVTAIVRGRGRARRAYCIENGAD